MRKVKTNNRVLDFLHRTTVKFLMGATVVSLFGLLFNIRHFYTVAKPTKFKEVLDQVENAEELNADDDDDIV